MSVISDEWLKQASRYAGREWDGDPATRAFHLEMCALRVHHAERHSKAMRARLKAQRAALRELGSGHRADIMTWRHERKAMARGLIAAHAEVERLRAEVAALKEAGPAPRPPAEADEQRARRLAAEREQVAASMREDVAKFNEIIGRGQK
jgi:hypothetical protein